MAGSGARSLAGQRDCQSVETRRLQWLADSTTDSHSGTLGPVLVTGERMLPLDDEIAAAGAFRWELLLELLCLARGDGIEAACLRQSSAYKPPLRRSSECEPSATITPRCSTMRRSISMTVLSRCAIAITLLPTMAARMACWMRCSLWLSRALVASSSSRMGASRMIARSMDIL